MGRHHRRPSRSRWLPRMTTFLGLFAAPAVVTPAAHASPAGVAEAIRSCESGDRNVEHGGDEAGVSTASGYYQFVNGTWRTFGGTEFAARAIGASKDEQTVVFERAYAANGLRDWEASRSCWDSKVGKHAPGKEAPRHVKERPTALHLADDNPAGSVVVRPGDTLSRIAAAHHTTWQAIYAANRDVVGNPHWIYPSERLRV